MAVFVGLLSVAVIAIIVSKSEAVTCYACNPCSNADVRSWGTCSGSSCFQRSGSHIAYAIRGCSHNAVTVAYCAYESLGGLLSKKRSLSTNQHLQTCFCTSEMCNGPKVAPFAVVRSSATSFRHRQPLQFYCNNLVAGLAAVGYFIAFVAGRRC